MAATIGTVSTGNVSNWTDTTITPTVDASATAVYILLSGRGVAEGAFSGVTVAGSAADLVDTVVGTNGGSLGIAIYRRLSPTTGTPSVVIDRNTSSYAPTRYTVIPVLGSDVVSPNGTVVSVDDLSAGASGTFGVTVPSATDNLVLALALASTTFTDLSANVGTERGDQTDDDGRITHALSVAGAASVSPTWNYVTDNPGRAYVAVGFSVNASGGGGGTEPPPTETPTDWTAVGGATLTATTDVQRTRVGGQSIRVNTATDGDGITSGAATVVPTAAKPYVSGYMSFWLTTGQVRVEMVVTNGTTTHIIPDPASGERAWSNQTETWVDLGIAGIDALSLADGAGSVDITLRLVQDGTDPCTVYLDAAQLTQSAGQLPLVEGSGATALWQEANRQLASRSQPLVRYDLDILDLSTVDSRWAALTVAPGDATRITDGELPVAGSTRVLETERDLLTDTNVKVVLSSRPEDLTDALVRPRPAPRTLRNAAADVPLSVQATFEPLATDRTQVRVRLEARPAEATIRYVLLDAGATVPAVGGAAWATYTQPFLVDRDQTAAVQVAAYATLANRTSHVSQWTIDQNPSASVTLSITEHSSGIPRVVWVPDIDVAAVRLYFNAAAGYPTLDGTATGTLDPTYLIGAISVQPDGGAVSSSGTALANVVDSAGALRAGIGGTAWQWNGSAFSPGAIVRAIAVPVDRGGVPGARATAIYSVVGSASPTINYLSIGAPTDSTGGSLSVGETAYCLASWSVNSAITGGAHDAILSSRINGGEWQQRTVITDPAGTTTFRFNTGLQYQTAKWFGVHTVEAKLEAVANSTTSPVLASAVSNTQQVPGVEN
jgi:hypothetical protein